MNKNIGNIGNKSDIYIDINKKRSSFETKKQMS